MKGPAVIIFVLFPAAWLVFAIFDFRPSSEIVAYTATRTSSDDHSLPSESPDNLRVYRVERNFVVSNVGGSVDKHEDCAIFDADNWECQYDDKSGWFGFRGGRYFSMPNTERFPYLSEHDQRGMSRFEYIVLTCRWDIAVGPMQALACFFRPFQG